jgi:uncharacterized protein
MTSWLFLFGLGILMFIVAASTVRSGLLLRDWIPGSNLLLRWPDNLVRLALAGISLVLGLTIGPGAAALTLGGHTVPEVLALGLAAGLVLALILTVAGFLAAQIWGESVASNKMLRCILPINRREWFGVLPALLLAALLEELLFRWLPLAGLTWLVSPWWLLWPLALFFGLLHWPQGWWGIAGTTLAAIFLSVLFLLTGSIWPALIAHYVMNVSQLGLAALAGMRPLRAS